MAAEPRALTPEPTMKPSPTTRTKSRLRIIRSLLAWISLVIGLYFGATLGGSLIGVNNDWREPDNGVRIFIETNGIHTAIVVPKRTAGHDWSAFIPASHLSDPSQTGEYLSFSWGHRQFYLDTPTWADIKLSTVGAVVMGSDETLMHVYHYGHPAENEYMRAVTITDVQYQQLVSNIEDKFYFNPDGTRPSPIAGYSGNDVFYEAKGRYTLINTCNTWTGDVLANIGMRVGAWTPMAGGVMRWFPQSEPS